MTSTVPPFTDTQATLLSRFLSSPLRPKDSLTYPQLAGFLFCLANGPELIPPSEWMPLIFNDQDAGYETQEEAERVLQAIMALYNDCIRERTVGGVSLPPGCEVRPWAMDNLDVEAPLSQWAQGFGIGYDYLVEVWNEYTPDELDKELGAVLMTLTFFTSPQLAQAYHQETKGKEGSLDQLAQSVMEIFPEAMREYAHLGRSIYQARLEVGTLDLEHSAHTKIERNDPCPCGSGKKYKKCCGLTKGTSSGQVFH
ncbi:MAG TPA: UPF0149 family protein [Nitrospira sp.]|nr:UPF0149 family protein [Nitrospira sp.]